MKATAFLTVFCAFPLLASTGKAQNAVIELPSNSVTIATLFSEIEKQTGDLVVYSNSELNVKSTITLSKKKAKVSDMLKEVLKDSDLQYEYTNNYIVFSKKGSGINTNAAQQAKKKKITGTILDKNGEPIIGANVFEKGTTNGTITDIDGKYALQVTEGSILSISYIGYVDKEIRVGKDSTIDITLAEDTQALEEVVVVGYGVVRKSDLTGSVGKVKSDVIEKMPVASVDQALQGRVSGMQITTANGAPGATTTIRIRGGNSINAGNEPLYVVDGIIGGGDLSTINPSDIESIEILKDASSTAIYGSRGANGVVLITTKRGEGADGVRLSYSGYYGLQTPVKKLDLLNGTEAAIFQNEYAEYYGRPLPFKNVNEVANTDWQDYIFQKSAPITDHNISVSNSTKSSNYFLSLNYFNQDGIMYESGFERYQIRFNVDQKIGSAFKIGATLTTAMTNRDNPILSGVTLLPTAPVYNENGSYFDVNQISGNVYDNPVAMRNGIQDKTRKFRGLGNVYAQLTLFKNLILKSSWGG